jgi:hypothetical protein
MANTPLSDRPIIDEVTCDAIAKANWKCAERGAGARGYGGTAGVRVKPYV